MRCHNLSLYLRTSRGWLCYTLIEPYYPSLSSLVPIPTVHVLFVMQPRPIPTLICFSCSIARCLGAKRVSKASYEWLSKHEVISHVLSDKDALSACVQIADDHRILVPPSCGVTLAAIYGDTIPELQTKGRLPSKLENIVVIVCGGSGVNLDTIQQWKTQINH